MKLVILGGGESGVGSAILAQAKGYDVFLSDFGIIKDNYRQMLDSHGIKWEDSGHTEKLILDADEVLKSPGIPDESPVMKKIIGKHIPVISEMEFASRYTKAKMICITGSNGKTTTTSLIFYILKKAGYNVGLAGNIGRSLALQVLEDKNDYYVIELSSFQLDNMYNFKADVSVLMNITPDHLDRYQFQMQRYIDSKMRIIQNQTPEDVFIYWKQDEHIGQELKRLQSTIAEAPTPSSRPAAKGNPSLCGFCDDDFTRLELEFSQPGIHNRRNAMAAYFAAKSIGTDEQTIRQCLKDFPGVEHRLEKVAVKDGITYINDSKATNVDACHVALQAINSPIVLILGGKDKGNDYSAIYNLVKEKCCALVYLGADNSKLHASFDSIGIPVADTHSMADCLKACRSFATEGCTVLLSPCCASFDLFHNMEDRGEQFKDCVSKIV